MLELDRLSGLRVVADPSAIDRATWRGRDVLALRIAPDDVLALDATGVDIDDEDAIVEPEVGFVGAWLTEEALTALVGPHIDWSLPADRPALAQGSIAGVPAKLWLTADGALLLTPAAYAVDLQDRLR